jgi:hypothetical protein
LVLDGMMGAARSRPALSGNSGPEFQLVSATFIFLSLFLGSAADFYYHFWWWDLILHIGSGFLLGIVGFLVLFLLNQTDRLPEGMRPVFLCFFGLTFAVFLGVMWEIFEFAVDTIVPGTNMLCWETGPRDTIVDLIVDAVGAAIVALMGWAVSKLDATLSLQTAYGSLFVKTLT